MKLELSEDNGSYTVKVGDKEATRLSRDEALGVVASALYAGDPIYVKTVEMAGGYPWLKDSVGKKP